MRSLLIARSEVFHTIIGDRFCEAIVAVKSTHEARQNECAY